MPAYALAVMLLCALVAVAFVQFQQRDMGNMQDAPPMEIASEADAAPTVEAAAEDDVTETYESPRRLETGVPMDED